MWQTLLLLLQLVDDDADDSGGGGGRGGVFQRISFSATTKYNIHVMPRQLIASFKCQVFYYLLS